MWCDAAKWNETPGLHNEITVEQSILHSQSLFQLMAHRLCERTDYRGCVVEQHLLFKFSGSVVACREDPNIYIVQGSVVPLIFHIDCRYLQVLLSRWCKVVLEHRTGCSSQHVRLTSWQHSLTVKKLSNTTRCTAMKATIST